MYDQTWTFLGEHCVTAEFNKEWKREISSLESDVGSGRRRPAEKEAFAIARLCAMINVVVDILR